MINRRTFLIHSAGVSALAGLLPAAAGNLRATGPRAGEMTILFQGDSITDGNRTRNDDWNHVMGHGFAYLIASRLWYDNPSRGFHFLNRGISGNRITHLAERWDSDTLALKPDVVNILVGINDTEAAIRGDAECTPERFESGYRELLKRTKTELPAIKLVICEPFVLPVGRVKEKWETYRREIGKRQEITKRLAVEFQAVYVPFQSAFDEALSRAPADYWIWDGIHPMPAGHELMARFWIEQAGATLGIPG